MTFVSATTSVYNSATRHNPLSVFLNTAITIQAGTIRVDQQNSTTVTLKDQNGQEPTPFVTIQAEIGTK